MSPWTVGWDDAEEERWRTLNALLRSQQNLYGGDYGGDGWADPDDEPSPPFWRSTRSAMIAGLVIGYILAWIPASVIIWKLTQ